MHAQLVIPRPGKENRKTGSIPTAYVARESCPSSCPLLGNGCYAQTGNIGLHWRKMNGVPWAKFCLMVAEKLGPHQLWRYAVAGDLPGFGGLIPRSPSASDDREHAAPGDRLHAQASARW